MRPRLTRSAVALGLVASLCGGVLSCGGSGQEPTVTIVVPWSGAELTAFENVVDPFAQSNHFQLDIQSTTAVAQQLDADAATKNLPDLVDLPSPGAVEHYENEVNGIKLMPLRINLKAYYQPWQSLAESSDTVYAVPVKADVKSLIWYKTGVLPNKTWVALQSVSDSGTPWCLGLNNGATASGWPGADWVADIFLSTYSPGAYESWLKGAWTSGQVQAAWNTWGTLIRKGAAVSGGALAALENAYNAKQTRTGCELEHGALSATGLSSTAGYSYEQFPSISGRPAPVLVSGDFMGLFTKNPDARMLLNYLSTTPAQEKWAHKSGGHAFSADSVVPSSDYPAGPERNIAENMLQAKGGPIRCFSAEDIMAPDLSAAFEQAILDYVSDPGSLSSLLSGLQKTANGDLKGAQGPGELKVAANACDLP